MPYIRRADRMRLHKFPVPTSPGELNYLITRMIMEYLERHNKKYGYMEMNDVVGVLECVKQEFYRRVASPYEDKKLHANGDVY